MWGSIQPVYRGYLWITTHSSEGELWRVILSLQALFPVYIGIDNFNELLNGTEDGDLIAQIQAKSFWMKQAGLRSWLRTGPVISVAEDNLNI